MPSEKNNGKASMKGSSKSGGPNNGSSASGAKSKGSSSSANPKMTKNEWQIMEGQIDFTSGSSSSIYGASHKRSSSFGASSSISGASHKRSSSFGESSSSALDSNKGSSSSSKTVMTKSEWQKRERQIGNGNNPYKDFGNKNPLYDNVDWKNHPWVKKEQNGQAPFDAGKRWAFGEIPGVNPPLRPKYVYQGQKAPVAVAASPPDGQTPFDAGKRWAFGEIPGVNPPLRPKYVYQGQKAPVAVAASPPDGQTPFDAGKRWAFGEIPGVNPPLRPKYVYQGQKAPVAVAASPPDGQTPLGAVVNAVVDVGKRLLYGETPEVNPPPQPKNVYRGQKTPVAASPPEIKTPISKFKTPNANPAIGKNKDPFNRLPSISKPPAKAEPATQTVEQPSGPTSEITSHQPKCCCVVM